MAEQRPSAEDFPRETLVAALRDNGVSYLVPGDADTDEVLKSPVRLLTALLCQPDARLKMAIVPLFLRQPALAESVPTLAARLDAPQSLELQTLYMAAVYLQRNWRSRLSIYLDDMTLLPDLFSRQMNLPPPQERFGKTGLYALAEAWQARSQYPFARLEALQNTIDRFFEQLKMAKATRRMRPQTDRQGNELFLQRLGRRFTRPGRLYLSGGTTMISECFRQQTLDIDITFEVADEHHCAFVAAVRDLKEQLSLNIEEASPAEFIPLPSGHQERSQYIGRYGQIDVFHFDLYSIALSKIERGTESDFDDVLTLLASGRLELSLLISYFDEIMTRYATESLKQDPVEYRRKFEILKEMYQSRLSS